MQRTVKQEYATFLTPAGQSIMGAVLRGEITLAFDKCQVGSGLWDVTMNELEGETSYTIDVPDQLLSPIDDGLFDIDTLTENSTGVTQATVNVPPDFGPATINEAAWLLDDGTIYAITRYAALPVIPPESGTSSEVSLRAFLNVGDVESVTLVVDSAINASREYVDSAIIETKEKSENQLIEKFALHLVDDDPHSQYLKESSFPVLLESNGYTVLPNGLLLQWGTVLNLTTSASVVVVFPLAFPTVCLNVQATLKNRIVSGTWSAQAYAYTQENFTIVNDHDTNTGTADSVWFAIGY
jgi:hypothetical protein